jgi:hypothetical protein
MVRDSMSYEAGAPSDNTSEDEGGFERARGVTPATGPTTRGHVSSSSFSSNATNEEIFHSGPRQQVQTPSTSLRSRPLWSLRSALHALEGAPRGIKAMKRHI